MTALPERLQDVLAAMRFASTQCAEFADRIEAALQPSAGGEVVAWLEPGTLNSASPEDYAAASAQWPDDYRGWYPVYLASPATPSGAFKAGDRVIWTDSSGIYPPAIGVVGHVENGIHWIDFPDGSVASSALAGDLTAAPSAADDVGGGK